MPNPLPDETAASIHTALSAGRKLDAVKLYREATGVGLAEAAASRLAETIARRVGIRTA